MILATIFRTACRFVPCRREHTRMGRRGGTVKIAAKRAILQGSGVLQLSLKFIKYFFNKFDYKKTGNLLN